MREGANMDNGRDELKMIESILMMMLSAQIIASDVDLDELIEVTRWIDSIVSPI